MPRETKQAPKAVLILTQQFHDARMKHAQELGAIAMETAGLDPKDGWLYNLDTGEFQRDTPEVPDANES